MSRIIIKQLPKNINEEKLRSLFASKGNITDMQMKYTPDGKFRQFGFIGYSSEKEACAAIEHFNNTCVQTSRIKVELCATLGSEEIPQSRSKYAKNKINSTASEVKSVGEEPSEKGKGRTKNKALDEIIGERKNDPEFLEFMKAHDKNRSLWGNDAGLVENESNKEKQKQSDKGDKQKEQKSEVAASKAAKDEEVIDEDNVKSNDDVEIDAKLAEKPISDLEYMKSLISGSSSNTKPKSETKDNKNQKPTTNDIDLFTIKIHNVPYKTKRQEIIKFFKPVKPYSVRLPTNVHGFCYVGFKTEKEMSKAMLKNKSFIKGKQIFFSDFTERNKITKSNRKGDVSAEDNLKPPSNPKWQQQELSLRNEEDISESGCIFFRNLPYTTTEEELQKVFELFGPITEIKLPVDTITRQIKGFGTVTFVMPENAMQAFNKLDGTDFHGRLLHLIPGKSKAQEDEREDNENMTFKEKKALKMKNQAQQSATWNTLFMGQNAVADILSKQFKMSKEQILDTSEGGSSAAVRLALGESQIVVEMKQFLEEHGVRLSSFDSQSTKRSKTVILAKNLPSETTVAELTPIFAKFGPVSRLLLPPTGVTALIEYCDPSEARQAFKKLAFSKFKTLPLFLEWAPENVFTSTTTEESIIPKLEETETKPDVEKEAEIETKDVETQELEDDADNEPEPNTTLFLRNLNFKTVADTVRKHFQQLGTIHTVEIAKRKDAQNPRQMNSLGYGFIQFKKAAVAENALKNMQLTSIDGNQVELKRSDRILKSADNQTHRRQTKDSKQTGTKLLVRNIPFQANQKEVRDIFKAFGELRSVRLPRKMTPGEDAHRGFGFVDYVMKGDAKKAYQALSSSTHLYGRRLVLEWASLTDEDVEELRKRTAAQYNGGSAQPTAKRSKRAVFDISGNINPVEADDEDK